MAGEIVTKSRRFYCVSLVPDFCRTPIGPNTPPIPYMIIGEFAEATGVSTNITSNGEPVVIHASTVIPTVKGDEPGTAKGIKSNTVGGRVQPMEKSSTLSFNGERAVRVGDLVYMNDKNTIGKVFERLDASAFNPFPKACEPGGTLAVLMDALEARAFLPFALMNLAPGCPSVTAAVVNAAIGSVDPSKSDTAATVPRQWSVGEQSRTNAGTLRVAAGIDGGVSRTQHFFNHVSRAVSSQSNSSASEYRKDLDRKYKAGTLDVFDEYADVFRSDSTLSTKLLNTWEVLTYNHPDGLNFGNVPPGDPNYFALALGNMAANPISAMIGGVMAATGKEPEDIYYATNVANAAGGILSASTGVAGRRAMAPASTAGQGSRLANNALDVPGRVQSRINLRAGSQAEGAGWNHVVHEHFSGKSNKSQFTVSQDEFRTILQSKTVVNSPVSRILESANGPRYVRDIDLGRVIGIDKFSGQPTSRFTILSDKYGNIVTASPGKIN
jgi:hypothetical protein